ncbi:MAG: extracellular solute-binding protein [Chloroflexi bacterium]|nr:extracellular solute-binding protein [Chloroflexota bacterium]
MLEAFQRGGEQWAIPWFVDPVILYYNTDLFQAVGVEPPAEGLNWQTFSEKAAAISQPDEGVFGALILSHNVVLPTLIYQNGGTLYDDYATFSGPTFNLPANTEALAWLTGVINNQHGFPTRAEQIRNFGQSASDLERAINQGSIGMWYDAYSQRGGDFTDPARAWPFNWGATALPVGKQAATTAQVYVFMVSAKAADGDAAFGLLEGLSRQRPPSSICRRAIRCTEPSNLPNWATSWRLKRAVRRWRANC